MNFPELLFRLRVKELYHIDGRSFKTHTYCALNGTKKGPFGPQYNGCHIGFLFNLHDKYLHCIFVFVL